MLISFWKEFWILSEPDKVSPALAVTRMPLTRCLWLRCQRIERRSIQGPLPRAEAQRGSEIRMNVQHLWAGGPVPHLPYRIALREGARPQRWEEGVQPLEAARAWDSLAGWFTGTQGQPKSGEMLGPSLHTNQGVSALLTPGATRSPPKLDY